MKIWTATFAVFQTSFLILKGSIVRSFLKFRIISIKSNACHILDTTSSLYEDATWLFFLANFRIEMVRRSTKPLQRRLDYLLLSPPLYPFLPYHLAGPFKNSNAPIHLRHGRLLAHHLRGEQLQHRRVQHALVHVAQRLHERRR